MSIFQKLFHSGAKDIINGAEKVLDKVVTSDEEKMKAKNELSEIVFNALDQLYDNQKSIVELEAKGNWLQRSWRPILMLSFGFIVIYAYFIEPAFVDTDKPIADTLNDNFWGLLKIGMGGYIIGRSAEKISRTVTANIDMPFLRKKDRKDNAVG